MEMLISMTAIYTGKDDKYLEQKALEYQAALYGVGPKPPTTPVVVQEPPAEIPDMAEAERIWKTIMDTSRGNG